MRQAPVFLTVAAALFCAASPAFADWIVFSAGGAMQVSKIERIGSNLRLTRDDGFGWVTVPPDRIDWAASASRSGHPVGPDQGASGGGGTGNGESATTASSTPKRRTRKGTPMPDTDTESYRAFAVRVKTPPKIDGRLDDAVWQDALPFGGFYQQDTHEGEPESERTEIRVVYDDNALYFAVRAYDREPKKIMSKNMLRSATLRTDDSIRILIDSLHDHQTAYLFGTNANGILVDSTQLGKDDQDTNWNGVWSTRGALDDEGWTAEVAVPFKTLKFQRADTHSWGLTVSRRIPRRNEFSYWPFIPNSSTFYWAGQCGHLEGIDDVKPGSSFQVKPYVAGGVAKDYTTGTSSGQRDVGLDFKYSLTPNLAADVTYRTDFAQTEVDDVQVNLTRFPLYILEKRQYFLDAARTFDFGLTKEAEIFYSRRIGLSESGRRVPIVAGGRLNGKAGKYYVGALNIQTADLAATSGSAAVPSTNWTAMRVSRDVGSRSRVGMMLTNRSPTGSSMTRNTVFGVDAMFYRGTSMDFQGFFAGVSDPSLPNKRLASRGAFEYTADQYGLKASYLDVQQNFRPGVGFVQRTGVRRTSVSARYSPRPRVLGIRKLYFEPTLNYFTTQANVPETREGIMNVESEFESGDSASIVVINHVETLFKPFPIKRNTTILAGTYTFTAATVSVSTAPGRPLNGGVRLNVGQFYDGNRLSVGVNGMWRLNKCFNITPSYSRDRINLPVRVFTTHILKTKFNFNVSALMSIDGLVQWSNDSRALTTNIRFDWIYKPGTDFYLVYTETDDTLGPFRPNNRTLVAKINYILDF